MRSMSLMPANGAIHAPSRRRAGCSAAGPRPDGRYFTPRSANGMSRTMMMALKMTADSTALCGECRRMTLKGAQLRKGHHEHRRDDGEVLGHVVGDAEGGQSAARDQELLADRTISMSLVGLESRSTMLPASLAADVPEFMATPTSLSREPARRWCRRRSWPPACPAAVLSGSAHLGFGRWPRQKVVDAGLFGDHGRGERVVAGDHHRADTHRPQLVEALANAALTMSLRWITPSTWSSRATASGVPPCRRPARSRARARRARRRRAGGSSS